MDKDGCPSGFYKKGSECVTEIPYSVFTNIRYVFEYHYPRHKNLKDSEAGKHFKDTAKHNTLRKRHIIHNIAETRKWLKERGY